MHTERALEDLIEAHLVEQGGWRKGDSTDFDTELALTPSDLFAFIQATQPDTWDKLRQHHHSGLETALLDRLIGVLDSLGTLDVLRHGVKFYGVPIRLAYFRPAHGLNPEILAQYAQNRLVVTRQVKCNPRGDESIDMLLSLNGLPIATMELKNQLSRGKQPNLSFFAFTATPKAKTLEIFGRPSSVDHKPRPFHLYSMRQAIEEGFILDVLKHYTTYKTYYRLVQTIEDDPQVEKHKATKTLARFMSLHPHNIAQKTQVIVEHFRHNVRHRIQGQAKAMVVTSSRLHAVKYKQAFDTYIAAQGYEDIKTLVAFSGTVVDEAGLTYTEPEMNRSPACSGQCLRQLHPGSTPAHARADRRPHGTQRDAGNALPERPRLPGGVVPFHGAAYL
jgi:type I site-specific restriction-modification system R (restriction) subunit